MRLIAVYLISSGLIFNSLECLFKELHPIHQLTSHTTAARHKNTKQFNSQTKGSTTKDLELNNYTDPILITPIKSKPCELFIHWSVN